MIEKDGRHNYSIDGEPSYYVGVTSILDVVDKSHALVPWAAKCVAEYASNQFKKQMTGVGHCHPTRFRGPNYDLLAKRAKKQWKFERDKAGDLGTRFHELMEDPNMPVPEDLQIAMKSANLWLNNTKLKLVKGRTKIISKKYGFGGEWDGLFKNEKDEFIIVDFKTGKRLYDSAASQCSAYGMGAIETFQLNSIPNGLVVRFGKEKVEFEEKEVLNMEQSFEYFKACLKLYNLLPVGQFGATRRMKGEKIK